jgi:hypothetical protein
MMYNRIELVLKRNLGIFNKLAVKVFKNYILGMILSKSYPK